MRDKMECLAMLLAGGRGERLGSLTQLCPKPAVSFGGGYRIVDFTLNNCMRSGITTVGVLSQYLADNLHQYLEGLVFEKIDGAELHMLPPRGAGYAGTADAIFNNIDFIDRRSPENVIILSSDHIYDMDYNKMLFHHVRTGANATIASTPVSWKDTSRFGIITSDSNTQITDFEEKPEFAKSNLASMGIYIFKWKALRKYLIDDNANGASRHDFGKDIIPAMLDAGERLVTYPFEGYWRDVGSIGSLWQANMDLLNDAFRIPSGKWSVYSSTASSAPIFISRSSKVQGSIISGGDRIFGDLSSSVLSDSVVIEEGAQIESSVIMSGAYIGKGAKISRAIIDSGAHIMDGVNIGVGTETVMLPEVTYENGICLVAANSVLVKQKSSLENISYA